MKINFTGDVAHLEDGLSIICNELKLERTNEGFTIYVKQKPGPIVITSNKDAATISFDNKIHFFRALGLWLEAYQKNEMEFHITETPQFEMNGAMIDASRNAVMTVDGIETLLRKMALMGLNVVMLYTEDTFTVEKHPFFGYMRGKYSEQELRRCDDVAHSLGIEMVPCIQTLAHLTEALKWNYASNMRDTSDILLVGSDETYEFIEELLKSASKPFRSKRIHIGMDEAHMLGLGKYLELNGFEKRFDIMNKHLQQVVSIASKHKLRPMIWSDMYFRLGSKTGGYYDKDAHIPQKIIDSIPKTVQLVYWDYYHSNEKFYQDFIKKHQAFGSNPIFAGGVWTWNGIAPNYGKTFVTTEAALQACKKEGVNEVFATMWGDNGAETNTFAGLVGLQLFAEHGYHKDIDPNRLKERFSFCTNGNMDDFLLLNEFDETPGVAENNMKESHPSKFLLWQDVLIGLYDFNIKGLAMNKHYKSLAAKLEVAKDRNKVWNPLFQFYSKLANVLSEKAEIGIKLKDAYDQNDRPEVMKLKERLSKLGNQVDELRKSHRKLWYWKNKAFGWEIIDIRYGGVLSRIESAQFRLQQWLNGEIEKIEELEAERLYHDAPWVMPEGALGRNSYHRIVSAGAFST